MRSKKRSFLMSLTSLILCVAMLVGSTFAWFTDTASNTGNRIVAGNLDIDLLMDKNNVGTAESYVSIAGGTGDIFKEAYKAQNSNETLWEPGKTQFAKLAVENKGNLAVKYTAYIDVQNNGLAGSLECALVTAKEPISTEGITNWAKVKEAVGESAIHPVTPGRNTIATGVLDEILKGTENERDYVLLAVHMKEEAGNEYQGKDAIIDVTIVATQKDAESDAFGPDYDEGAEGSTPAVPIHEAATGETGGAEDGNTKLVTAGSGTAPSVEATIPTAGKGNKEAANQFKAERAIEAGQAEESNGVVLYQTGDETGISSKLTLNVDQEATTRTSVTYEITMNAVVTKTVGGETVETKNYQIKELSEYTTATIQIGPGKKEVKVKHSNVDMTGVDDVESYEEDTIPPAGIYSYNEVTGNLVIKTKTFSPFEVSYTVEAVAKIGDKEYTSLEAAVKAAKAFEDKTTISLLQDVQDGNGIDFESGHNVVIDFNNHTYTLQGEMVGSDGTKTNGFRVLSGATVELKNGTLLNGNSTSESSTPAKVMLNSYGTTKLDNFSVLAESDAEAPSGSPYGTAALYVANGQTTVTGNGTYSAAKVSGGKNCYAIYMANVEYYSAGAGLVFDGAFTGTVTGNVITGSQQLAQISIANGYYDLGTIDPKDTMTISITGGTFTFDPTQYVAEGYLAEKSGDVWIIKADPMPQKGTLIKMDLVPEGTTIYPVDACPVDDAGKETYRILKRDGSQALVLAMYDAVKGIDYNNEQKVEFDNGSKYLKYDDSKVDQSLTDFYGKLTDAGKGAIVATSIKQGAYSKNENQNMPLKYDYIYDKNTNKNSTERVTERTIGTRNVFALDISEIYDYLGKNECTINDLISMFYNESFNDSRTTDANFVWLRSASTTQTSYEWSVLYGTNFSGLNTNGYNYALFGNSICARPAFYIDLDKIAWDKVE